MPAYKKTQSMDIIQEIDFLCRRIAHKHIEIALEVNLSNTLGQAVWFRQPNTFRWDREEGWEYSFLNFDLKSSTLEGSLFSIYAAVDIHSPQNLRGTVAWNLIDLVISRIIPGFISIIPFCCGVYIHVLWWAMTRWHTMFEIHDWITPNHYLFLKS